MRPPFAPVAAYVVTVGKRRLRADGEFKVGVFVRVLRVVETACHHWPLVEVGAEDVVGGEQHDAGVPLVAVDAEIVAPFFHRTVVDDVGCPHVAVDVVAAVRPSRPVHGIEGGEVHFLPAFRHLLDGGGNESLGVGGVVLGGGAPGGVGLRPVFHVGGVGAHLVRAEDVVALQPLVIDHGWVVDAHAGLGGGQEESLCLRGGQLCLSTGSQNGHDGHENGGR